MTRQALDSLFAYIAPKARQAAAMGDAIEVIDKANADYLKARRGRRTPEQSAIIKRETFEDFQTVKSGKSISEVAELRGISYSALQQRFQRDGLRVRKGVK